jgi:hypothetical protein
VLLKLLLQQLTVMVAVRLMEGLARVSPPFNFELRVSTGGAFGFQRDAPQPFGDPHLRLIRPHSFSAYTRAEKDRLGQ